MSDDYNSCGDSGSSFDSCQPTHSVDDVASSNDLAMCGISIEMLSCDGDGKLKRERVDPEVFYKSRYDQDVRAESASYGEPFIVDEIIMSNPPIPGGVTYVTDDHLEWWRGFYSGMITVASLWIIYAIASSL